MADAMKNIGTTRLTMIGGVTFALIGFFIYLMTRLTTPQMSILYGDLSQDDTQQIIQVLGNQHIPYEIGKQDGAIFVPSDHVLAARMKLAEQGLPSGGSVGYEIFDKADALGSTNFLQNVNLVRALEGELARTIRSLEDVKAARVHLVMPRRELFSRERQKPSASVVLRMKGSNRLSREKVQSIQHMVAAAVPSLEPDQISIIDDKGTLLAKGFEKNGGGSAAEDLNQQRAKLEEELARTVEELLERTVGFGKVRAEVRAEMDFSRETSSEEEYDPEGQVVRSTVTSEAQVEENESDGQSPVSVGTNLPDANSNSGDSVTSAGRRENQTTETVNYEISKKVINRVRETALITRLSVAVLVDGFSKKDAEGNAVYEPRSQEDMDHLTALVQSAIGYDKERGDVIEVVNMRFTEVEQIDDGPEILFWGFTKDDVMRLAEILVLSIVALLVILLVVRPLISRAFEQQAASADLMDQQALTGPSAGPVPVPSEAQAEEEDQFEELIDIDRVEGRVKASSVKKVGEIVEKHPEEALAIIRNWMYQEG